VSAVLPENAGEERKSERRDMRDSKPNSTQKSERPAKFAFVIATSPSPSAKAKPWKISRGSED
jgi:hypothetical protein